jgi:hydrogenase maturation protease
MHPGMPNVDSRVRLLVAGIGNIFLGDDGFGVEVVRRLREGPQPAGALVADFGIRGIHLAYELADGRYDAAILVDAVARGGEPGTLYRIEAEPDEAIQADAADAHSLTPAMVVSWLRRIGANCRVIVIGCEPASLDETIGLSPAVAASVDDAVRLVREVVAQLTGAVQCA